MKKVIICLCHRRSAFKSTSWGTWLRKASRQIQVAKVTFKYFCVSVIVQQITFLFLERVEEEEEDEPDPTMKTEVSVVTNLQAYLSCCYDLFLLCCSSALDSGSHKEHRGSADSLLLGGAGKRDSLHADSEPGSHHSRAVRVPPRGQARDPVRGRGDDL